MEQLTESMAAVEVEPPTPPLPTEQERLMVHELSRLPEKICLCVDVSDEMDSPWELKGGKTMPRLTVVKKALQNFVQVKSWFNARHSFAICTLGDEAEWLLDFTCETEMVQTMLEGLHVQPGCDPAFDMGKLFDTLQAHCPPLPSKDDADNATPAQVVRAVVIYGRSTASPHIPPPAQRPPPMSSPSFYLDVLYMHAHPGENTTTGGSGSGGGGGGGADACQDTYNALHSAIAGGATATAYLVEQIHSARVLGRHLALLLAHAAQRQERDVLGRHVYYNADPDAATAAAAAAAGGGGSEKGGSSPVPGVRGVAGVARSASPPAGRRSPSPPALPLAQQE